MYCRKCGTQLPDNAAFCSSCGTKVMRTEASAAERVTSAPAQNQAQAQASQATYAAPSQATYTASSQGAYSAPPQGAYTAAPQATPPASASAAEQAIPVSAPEDHPYRQLGGYLAFLVYGNYILGAVLIVLTLVNMVQTIMLYNQYAQYDIFGLMDDAIGASVIGWIGYIVIALFSFWWATVIKNRNPKFLLYYHVIMIIEIILIFLVQVFTVGILVAFLSCLFYVGVAVVFTLYFVKSERVRIYFGTDQYLRESPITRTMVDQV